MNQSALKTFAQDARNKLRQLIGARLDYVLTADTAELRQQAAQVNELHAALASEGRDPLIERVAYTWFNRLAALRFMDANGYHPFGARVITPATANETLPELLQQARAGALDADIRATLANPRTFDDLLAGRIPVDHPEAQVFKLLLVATCNYYHRLMPFLFEQLGDATELLLPEDLLTEHSIVADFRDNLADEDCREVEVIGWLYQFYISEKKDAVMARKSAVPTADIPAVTQLFTPHWIVRYLIENSLGRLWLLNRPHSRLREKMPYYIEGEAEADFLKITKPEDIRLLDPAGGSGHMLTYAFDLLYAIYEEEGYDAPEIPSLILRHNLYGVDICDRAAALAAFALCMKARAKDIRFFRRLANGGADAPRPHIIELRDVRFAENELRDYFKAIGLASDSQLSTLNPQLNKLLHQFEEAKNFGSLIQPFLDERAIAYARRAIEAKDLGGQLFLRETHLKVLRVLEQAEALTQRYHVVVANPPYMGSGNMNPSLKRFATENYEQSRNDLFSMFTWRSFSLGVPRSYSSFVTMHSWMFLSGFEKFRKSLLTEKSFVTMAHLGPRGFDAIGGEVVQTTAFVCWNFPHKKSAGAFFRLTAGNSEAEKDALFREAAAKENSSIAFRVGREHFLRIPGEPLAYWASEAMSAAFTRFENIATLGETRIGLITGENSRYIRNWHEVAWPKIGLNLSRQEAASSNKRWFPQSKGGGYRKWYGNNETVVDWSADGKELQTRMHSSGERILAHNFNLDRIFQPAITWTKISGGDFAARLQPHGFLFNDASANLFIDSAEARIAVLAFLSSCLPIRFLEALNPTLNFLPGNVSTLPFVQPSPASASVLATEAVSLARADWDNFETSWDFRDQPLLRPGLKGATLEASWRNWEAQSTAAIRRMQELETENNRLFIAAYGLDGELQPEVPEAQITLARAEARRDMAAFLSYAVGCMMGRYSLRQPGLILANAGDTLREFLEKVGKPLAELTFAPDEDGIIPVLDGEWFEDDIVARTRDFLRATFGDGNFAENLAFIEASLGKELRKYFAKEFYKDHLQTYKKRPIYWMFSSPEGSFQALIYLHRYTRDTVSLLLNDYVREFIGKLEERHRQLTAVTLNESARPGDRTKAVKELGKIAKMQKELKAWERDVLLPLAQQRIELDLDDGVKVNYLKFKGAVVNIPGLDKGEEE